MVRKMKKIVLILGLITLLSLTGCQSQHSKALDDFCKNQGYNEATDFYSQYSLYSKNDIKIECDGEKIFEYVREISLCRSRDKWGYCNTILHDYIYELDYLNN